MSDSWTAVHQASWSFAVLMGFSQQRYGSDLLFPPPVDYVLSEFFTMTCPSWWLWTAPLIASLSCANPFSTTRLWSMKGTQCLGTIIRILYLWGLQGFFFYFVFQTFLSFHIYKHTSLYAEVVLIGYNTIYLRNKLFKYVCRFMQM